jgi:hypothetical protein
MLPAGRGRRYEHFFTLYYFLLDHRRALRDCGTFGDTGNEVGVRGPGGAVWHTLFAYLNFYFRDGDINNCVHRRNSTPNGLGGNDICQLCEFW